MAYVGLESVKREALLQYICVMVLITAWAVVSSWDVREIKEAVDDLCRAHYPECIVEQK